ncbi:MAG TPA: zinc ribbon domain-containing protein [Verrucomicrobiae bacterium]
MPTYEYACSKCGHQFEKIQPIAAKSLTVCLEEVCPQKKWGRGKVKRLISAGGGLIFKGSGFYITDYRSEKYKQAAKKDSKDSTATTPPAGETKPAPAKSEAKPAKTSTASK